MIARFLSRWHRDHPMWSCASQACILCRQSSSSMVCSVCNDDLVHFDLGRCNGNLMRLPAISLQLPDVPFKHVLAMAPYVWPYDQWITQLKFSQRLQHTRPLSEKFVEVCREYIEHPPQCIWPTPLHPQRLMQRQFNQAYQVAQSIGNTLNIPVSEGPLSRTKATPPQTELSGRARRRNVKSAFRAKDVPDLDHVVLFDDVMTTGATLAAQYQALKEKRPQMRIDIWSLCISLPQQQLAACVNKA